jgi:hypothetical protein
MKTFFIAACGWIPPINVIHKPAAWIAKGKILRIVNAIAKQAGADSAFAPGIEV